VTLTAAGSTNDPPGEAVTYMWTQDSGPSVTLSDPTAVMPTFTAPGPGSSTLVFTVQVCDAASQCSTDSVTINVVNNAPTANAGPDQTVPSSAPTVQLNGSGSTDPEGQALTYMWTQTLGDTVTLSDPTAVSPTFAAPIGPQDLTFQLQVCDPEPLCSTDTVTIHVQAPPMIDASGDVIVNGPVSHTKTSKNFVFKVSNVGTTSITINPGDITSSVDVNGTTTGSVSVAGLPVTIGPGASKRLKLSWSYGSALVGGETVDFNACVNMTGDIDTSNDCDTATVTAK
jgi:hypothetical protein